MNRMRRGKKGNAMLEFTLAGIPILFIQFSIVEICRGMWDYHSLAEAVKIASRSVATHGADCAGQACATTVGQVAQTITNFAGGMPASALNVTLTSNAKTVTCNPLSSCSGSSTAWPSIAGNSVGSDIVISASYSFTSMLAMFVPGKGSMSFSSVTFTAQSRQTLLY